MTLALALLCLAQESYEGTACCQATFTVREKDRPFRMSEVLAMMAKRVSAANLKRVRFVYRGGIRFQVQIADIEHAELKRYLAILGHRGGVELRILASEDEHRKWKAGGEVPFGYVRMNVPKELEGRLGGSPCLVRRAPVVVAGGKDRYALTQRPEDDGWVMTIELPDEESGKFESLSGANRDRLLLMMDGNGVALPAFERTGSKIRLDFGAEQKVAERMAAVLRVGTLPASISDPEITVVRHGFPTSKYVPGAEYADRMNDAIVSRIADKSIRTPDEITSAFLEDTARIVLLEMGFDPDEAKISEEEKVVFNGKMEKFKIRWVELLGKK